MNTILNKTYDETLDGDTAKLLDWLGLYQSFFAHMSFPACPTASMAWCCNNVGSPSPAGDTPSGGGAG